MKMIYNSSCTKHEWIFFIGCFMWRMEIRCLNEGLSLWVFAFIFILGYSSAGIKVMSESFAVFQLGIENPIGVNMFRSIRMLLVTRPLNTAAFTQLCITQTCIIARSAAGAIL